MPDYQNNTGKAKTRKENEPICEGLKGIELFAILSVITVDKTGHHGTFWTWKVSLRSLASMQLCNVLYAFV